MNSIVSALIPWVTSASAVFALVASMSFALSGKRLAKKQKLVRYYNPRLNSYKERYANFFSITDDIDGSVANLIEKLSTKEDDLQDITTEYEKLLSGSTDLRWLVAEDIRFMRNLNGEDFEQAVSLYNKFLGRLEGTQKLLVILHERILLKSRNHHIEASSSV